MNRLQFRREKEGAKGACRILMRTSIGKAVINANLYDNMSVTFAEQKDKKDGSMKRTGVILTIFNACENSAEANCASQVRISGSRGRAPRTDREEYEKVTRKEEGVFGCFLMSPPPVRLTHM